MFAFNNSEYFDDFLFWTIFSLKFIYNNFEDTICTIQYNTIYIKLLSDEVQHFKSYNV